MVCIKTVKDFLMISLLRKSSQTWKRFWADASGAVLFYITATLPALVGFSLLAIDASRLMTLHTSLQKGVDALSLAAAGELDRTPEAIIRARLAAENLLKNTQVFGEGDVVIGDTDPDPNVVDMNVTLNFYDELPTSDADSMSTITKLDPTDPKDVVLARFVEVTVDTYNMNSIFPASFLGGVDSATSNATAVAGMTQVVCRLAPLFICNPWEKESTETGFGIYETDSIYDAQETRLLRRRQIRVRIGPGGNADWFPGNYGFLDWGSGAKDLEKALAVGRPDTCFSKSGVDTKTGQNTGPVKDGINTRFGLYANLPNEITKPWDENWSVRPAKNVRMGQPQNAAKLCDEYSPDADNTNGMALPRDPVFVNDGERVGTSAYPSAAQWEEYFNSNFPAYVNTNQNPLTNGVDEDDVPTNGPNEDIAAAIGPPVTNPRQAQPDVATWATVTRYDMYRWEIATAGMLNDVGGNMVTPIPGSGEVGDPWEDPNLAEDGGARCFKGTKDIDDPLEEIDRRLIGVAIMNCNALEASGYKMSGHISKAPVAVFAQFFPGRAG